MQWVPGVGGTNFRENGFDARLQSAGSYKRHSKLLALGFADLTFSPGGRIVRRAIGDLFTLRAFPIDTTVQQEQAWNTLQMAEPVTAPVFASGRTEIPPSCWVVRSAPCMPKRRSGYPGMNGTGAPVRGGAVLTGRGW